MTKESLEIAALKAELEGLKTARLEDSKRLMRLLEQYNVVVHYANRLTGLFNLTLDIQKPVGGTPCDEEPFRE